MELYVMTKCAEAAVTELPEFAVCKRASLNLPNTEEYFAQRDRDAEQLVSLASKLIADVSRLTARQLRAFVLELEGHYPSIADVLMDLIAWKEENEG